jgi:hypothetical protein
LRDGCNGVTGKREICFDVAAEKAYGRPWLAAGSRMNVYLPGASIGGATTDLHRSIHRLPPSRAKKSVVICVIICGNLGFLCFGFKFE